MPIFFRSIFGLFVLLLVARQAVEAQATLTKKQKREQIRARKYAANHPLEFTFTGEGKFKDFTRGTVKSTAYMNIHVATTKGEAGGGDKLFLYVFKCESATCSLQQSAVEPKIILSDAAVQKANKNLAARIDLALENLHDSAELRNFYGSL